MGHKKGRAVIPIVTSASLQSLCFYISLMQLDKLKTTVVGSGERNLRLSFLLIISMLKFRFILLQLDKRLSDVPLLLNLLANNFHTSIKSNFTRIKYADNFLGFASNKDKKIARTSLESDINKRENFFTDRQKN